MLYTLLTNVSFSVACSSAAGVCFCSAKNTLFKSKLFCGIQLCCRRFCFGQKGVLGKNYISYLRKHRFSQVLGPPRPTGWGEGGGVFEPTRQRQVDLYKKSCSYATEGRFKPHLRAFICVILLLFLCVFLLFVICCFFMCCLFWEGGTSWEGWGVWVPTHQ